MMIQASVAIIDDDPAILALLRKFYSLENYSVSAFTNASDALASFDKRKADGLPIYQLVVSDLKLPDLSGIELLEKIHSMAPKTPVILVTAHGSVETAVDSLKRGAFDYVVKPIDFGELSHISKRAIHIQNLEADRQSLEDRLKRTQSLGLMIGKSKKIQEVFDLIERVAKSVSNVLITGESGTGKEMVARAIHAQSTRNENPFIAINCSTIPGNLLESELFGHKKGSFTGATDSRKGLFEEGQGGTIFLDEIGDMPLELQAKLLRVLQERQIKPVGENKSHDIDVRILAATLCDLKTLVQEDKFREDLFYRLCVIPIQVPALRDRTEDIPLLAEHFVKKYCEINQLPLKTLSKAAIAKLIGLPWPGNVRELENAIERCVVLSDKTVIEECEIKSDGIVKESGPTEFFQKLPTLKELESSYINYVLNHTGQKKEKASEILGIDRKTLYRSLQAKEE
ncbi:MAG: sigma-54 dependent transcriptional regulator [Bdellovibrionia bacterium]